VLVVQPVETLKLVRVQLTPSNKLRGGVPLPAALAALTPCTPCCCGSSCCCGVVLGVLLLLLVPLLLLFALLLSEQAFACCCFSCDGCLAAVIGCYLSSKLTQVLQTHNMEHLAQYLQQTTAGDALSACQGTTMP
jgi:hypothetical protein